MPTLFSDKAKKSQARDFACTGFPQEAILEKFETSRKVLSEKEAQRRLEEYGYNEPAKKKKRIIILQILSKFINPLVIVLLVIAGFSFFFGEKESATVVMLMAVLSVFLSFIQDYRACRLKWSRKVNYLDGYLRNFAFWGFYSQTECP